MLRVICGHEIVCENGTILYIITNKLIEAICCASWCINIGLRRIGLVCSGGAFWCVLLGASVVCRLFAVCLALWAVSGPGVFADCLWCFGVVWAFVPCFLLLKKIKI